MEDEIEQPELMTLEEIQGTIRAARDSVWVIDTAIGKLSEGAAPSNSIQNEIGRNVAHLKIITSNSQIVESGEDISDLLAAIETGEAKLAEDIW
jgi:hypothetical protein